MSLQRWPAWRSGRYLWSRHNQDACRKILTRSHFRLNQPAVWRLCQYEQKLTPSQVPKWFQTTEHEQAYFQCRCKQGLEVDNGEKALPDDHLSASQDCSIQAPALDEINHGAGGHDSIWVASCTEQVPGSWKSTDNPNFYIRGACQAQYRLSQQSRI